MEFKQGDVMRIIEKACLQHQCVGLTGGRML